MGLTFEPAEILEARRVNRLLATTPRMLLRNEWDVAMINGALSLTLALPGPDFRQAGLRVENRRVEAGGRDALVRIVRPEGPCRGVYIGIHGGAWVLGSARMDDRLNAQLAETCNIAVVSVEYRLALKNPVHAVLDDCETAALWVIEALESEFGCERVFIGGESAGAHLAASTALRLRGREADRGRIAGMVLLYGCYDLCGTPSLLAAGPDTLIFHGPTLGAALGSLLPDMTDEQKRCPSLSPLYADLRGLPPSLMLVGDLDPLIDDTTMMAERWAAAGGAVELHLVPEAPHGFNRLPTAMARKTNAYVRGWVYGKLALAERAAAVLDGSPSKAVA